MGLGFLVGIDIYDCVLVINTKKALEAFTRFRCTIGGDLSVSAGPVGAGAILETELHKRQAPIFNYMKSRGFYAGVSIDGTVIIERVDENERFYHQRIPAHEILEGKVRHPPYECRGLLETLKAAEGDATADASFIPDEIPPSDYEIQQEGHVFSVPDKDDPDPYGVLQLEKEGLVVREAGTQKRASWDQFTFAPSASSPVFDTYDRKVSKGSRASFTSRRSSGMPSPNPGGPGPIAGPGYARSSNDSPRTPGIMSDAGTQTDDQLPTSPGQGSFRWGTAAGSSRRSSMEHIPEDDTTITVPKVRHVRSVSGSNQGLAISQAQSPKPELPAQSSPSKDENRANTTSSAEESHEAETADTTDPTEDDDEEPVVVEAPVVHSVKRTITPQVIQKARMVTVPKRGPPPSLPPRNPNRSGPSDRPSSVLSANSNSDSLPRTSTEQAARSLHDGAADEMTDVDLNEPPRIILQDHDVPEDSKELTGADETAHPSEEAKTNHTAAAETQTESPGAEFAAAEEETVAPAVKDVQSPDIASPEEASKDPWKRVLERHESIEGNDTSKPHVDETVESKEAAIEEEDDATEAKDEDKTKSEDEVDGKEEDKTHSGRQSPEVPGSFN